jgi:alanine dehydrogenase
MLIIDNDTVAQLRTMADCIRVQEEAFRKLPTDGAIHRPRIDVYFPCEREDGYFRCPEPTAGSYFLVSTRNAEPRAFIHDGILQHMRVGGGAAIGAKYLSRDDTHVAGMLGSGGMARAFLEAFTCVRDIRRCKIYSPNPEHREAFAAEMSRRLGIEVRPVDSAREAVRGVDLLSSCTDSMRPTRACSSPQSAAGSTPRR